MDDIKATAAELHDKVAHSLELAAGMHHDAAKQCRSGNFEKAQSLAAAAGETYATANRHAIEAVDVYRHHAEEVAARRAEQAAEEAAREAKHQARDA